MHGSASFLCYIYVDCLVVCTVGSGHRNEKSYRLCAFYKAQEPGSLSPSWAAEPQGNIRCIKADINYDGVLISP